ncbi:MAG: ABC transporter permease [Alphaproteobacteria bacterium]
MNVLDRKLFRDLYRMWAQSLAIALVMACGVATLILSVGAFRSLDETRTAYYERYRFGDVFANAVRVPMSVAREIASIDGVAAVEPRVQQQVLLDIDNMEEPATGMMISLPSSGEVGVNALFVEAGRLPEPTRSNEAVVNVNFAEAHHMSLGSTFRALINGSLTTITVVGVVRSPEFIYTLAPGEMMPDNRRYGVIWMPEATLASLFDLSGAFNSISLRLLRDVSETAVIQELDSALEAYGGTGAYARKDQLSHAFIQGELTQLDGMSRVMPPIFLAVSAFLINMILSRLIALEREQIGLLKALGYGRFAVAWHYLKLVLVIAAIGVVIGAGLGTWAGRGLTIQYSKFFSFPFLLFQSSADLYLLAAAISMAAAVLGALRAILTAFALPAAVAMRPPAPAVYRQLFGGLLNRVQLFSQLTIMGFRHLMRHPVRAGMTALGIAFAVALPAVGLGTVDSIEDMMDTVYYRADRQDATMVFTAPRGIGAIEDVENLPGVIRAEPFLSVPVRIRNGHYSRQLGVIGKPAHADLSRVLDIDLKAVMLPETGLSLGDRVADILNVRVGDVVRVEMLTGERRVVDVPVTQIISAYIGLNVFMEIGALARMTGTGPRVSGTYIDVDSLRINDLYRTVKATPQLASVTLQAVALDNFRKTMRENIVVMMSVYIGLSVIIAFGVVYNSARIQLSERARELATLRVLGFRRGEVSRVLFVETGTIVLVAQPLGWLIGAGFGVMITSSLATDLFRVPFVINIDTFAISSLVIMSAALASALIVRRRINRLDLVQVLKTRE